MQANPGLAEEVTATLQVCPVVDVAAVGRAPTALHDLGLSQLCEVVRDEVLRLGQELRELTDSAIACCERLEDLPPDRICEEPENGGRINSDDRHVDDDTSNQIDVLPDVP